MEGVKPLNRTRRQIITDLQQCTKHPKRHQEKIEKQNEMIQQGTEVAITWAKQA